MTRTAILLLPDSARRLGVDRWAQLLSGACVAHCLGTAVLLAWFGSIGGMLGGHGVHVVGLLMAIALGLYALVRGALTSDRIAPFAVGCFGLGVMAGALAQPHHSAEAIWTVFGATILAGAHELNGRLRCGKIAGSTRPA